MFERFTERARQVIILAQDEARGLGHGYIGTEHLLLGLLREEQGIAARVLVSLGVPLDDVRSEVARIVGEGDVPATGQIPFTPRAKKVLEHSLSEALRLGHNHIGTEHVLLGLARENDGVAAQILLDRGVDAETIQNEVIRTIAGPGPFVSQEISPVADIGLTSPPLAPEVIVELDRLADEKQQRIDRKEFDAAARLAEQERRLRSIAGALVREWQRREVSD